MYYVELQINKTYYSHDTYHQPEISAVKRSVASAVKIDSHNGYLNMESQFVNNTDNSKNLNYFLWYRTAARFGNNIFQYVCAYTTAMQTNYVPIIASDDALLTMFPHIYAKRLSPNTKQLNSKYLPFDIHNSAKYENTVLQSVREARVQKKNATIFGFFQSWKYMRGFEDDIRYQLRVNQTITSAAEDKIHAVTHQYFTVNDTNNLDENSYRITYIGVHVRRKDMAAPSTYRGMCSAPAEYINKAMQYYRNLHEHTIFIVVSDDIKWCKENITVADGKKNDIFFSDGSYMDDFALLVNCNHSIITVGMYILY